MLLLFIIITIIILLFYLFFSLLNRGNSLTLQASDNSPSPFNNVLSGFEKYTTLEIKALHD